MVLYGENAAKDTGFFYFFFAAILFDAGSVAP